MAASFAGTLDTDGWFNGHSLPATDVMSMAAHLKRSIIPGPGPDLKCFDIQGTLTVPDSGRCLKCSQIRQTQIAQYRYHCEVGRLCCEAHIDMLDGHRFFKADVAHTSFGHHIKPCERLYCQLDSLGSELVLSSRQRQPAVDGPQFRKLQPEELKNVIGIGGLF